MGNQEASLANLVSVEGRERNHWRAKLPATLVFGGTLFFSALLMFMLQPMFAKMALPRLGGSAAVWSLALVFFQAVLLCGYGYAHLVATYLRPRQAVLLHAAVMLIAAACLPVAIAEGWDVPPETGEALWVLGLFASSVGLPFFAISANAPLLQSWYSRLGHVRSGSPYFLYAASNIGSIAALLAYPFLIEPFVGLGPQSKLWTVGYALLGALLSACGIIAASLAGPTGDKVADSEAPTPGRRLLWVLLSFVPSGLLVGTTAHLATDLVSAPFMWVVPLALYLLTFVITFQQRPWLPHEFVIGRLLVIAAPVCILVALPFTDLIFLPFHLAAAFVLMVACHGELVRLRPAPDRLTEFYFLMSLGGVLGGCFASLIAPFLFSRVLEYPLLIAAAFAVVGLARQAWTVSKWMTWLLAGLLPGAGIYMLAMAKPDEAILNYTIAAWLVCSLVLLIAARRHLLTQAVVLLTIVIVYPSVSVEKLAIERERSLYGVSTVYGLENGRFHVMAHGVTEHGSQQWTDQNGKRLTGRPEPGSYYYPGGPFGKAIGYLRSNTGRLSEVAVVGMGAGSMTCHAKPDETWSYFEIDPVAMKFASDPTLFTLLRDCGFQGKVVLGDGRLKLQKEPDGRYDLIILDAFSSDAVPAHLLTVEAVAMYLQKLKADGALILHISNKFMDLTDVVEGAARANGAEAYVNILSAKIWSPDVKRHQIMPQVAVIGKSSRASVGFAVEKGWIPLKSDREPRGWTDDYSNVLSAIWRKQFGKSAD